MVEYAQDKERLVKHTALLESTELASLLFDAEQKQIAERAAQEIHEKPDTYDLSFFWSLDSSIGGVGGYCMPFNPVSNPFPGGIGRTLFRPAQYAAADIECNKALWNNYRSAKSAVNDSGQHLEAVTRYVLARTAPVLSPAQFKRSMLGQNVRYLADKHTLSSDTVTELELLTRLYNKSKHEVNQDNERERLFFPADALVVYLSARILGRRLLKPYYPDILKEIKPYLGNLNGLNCSM